MGKSLYQVYSTRRPCGAVALSNCFGLLVFEPTEEDRPETDFITAWSGTEGARGFRRNKIHYTAAGRGFIRKGSLRFYLDEILKI